MYRQTVLGTVFAVRKRVFKYPIPWVGWFREGSLHFAKGVRGCGVMSMGARVEAVAAVLKKESAAALIIPSQGRWRGCDP